MYIPSQHLYCMSERMLNASGMYLHVKQVEVQLVEPSSFAAYGFRGNIGIRRRTDDCLEFSRSRGSFKGFSQSSENLEQRPHKHMRSPLRDGRGKVICASCAQSQQARGRGLPWSRLSSGFHRNNGGRTRNVFGKSTCGCSLRSTRTDVVE